MWRGHWADASERLHATNNFPEFTGRLCPAPCEGACVLGINADPVTIERVEYEIAERAFAEDWVVPVVAESRTEKVGGCRGFRSRRAWPAPSSWPGPATTSPCSNGPRSPAGYCATASPNSRWRRPSSTAAWPSSRPRGHLPLRHRRRGGRPTVPVMPAATEPSPSSRGSGAVSAPPVRPTSPSCRPPRCSSEFDAVVLAGGATLPRDLPVPGRGLRGVHGAMEYLKPSNLVREGALGRVAHQRPGQTRDHHRRR